MRAVVNWLSCTPFVWCVLLMVVMRVALLVALACSPCRAVLVYPSDYCGAKGYQLVRGGCVNAQFWEAPLPFPAWCFCAARNPPLSRYCRAPRDCGAC